jgi:hypothetical protein
MFYTALVRVAQANNICCKLKLTPHPLPPHGATAPSGQGLLIIEASQSHSDIPYTAGFLWTSDHTAAETSMPADPRLIPRGQSYGI